MCTNMVGAFSCSCTDGFTLNSDFKGCDGERYTTLLCSLSHFNGSLFHKISTNVWLELTTVVKSVSTLRVVSAVAVGRDSGSTQTEELAVVSASLLYCHSPLVSGGKNDPLSPDIDECASDDTNSCEQQCINSVGSYTCKCNDGFTLNSDGTTCSGEITGSSSHRVSNAKQSWHLICTYATIYSMLQILMSVS